MSDLERRLEDLFTSDSRARRVKHVAVGARQGGSLRAAAFVGAVALATIAAVVTLSTLRGPSEDTAATPPSASPSVTAPAKTNAPSTTVVCGEATEYVPATAIATGRVTIVRVAVTPGTTPDSRTMGSPITVILDPGTVVSKGVEQGGYVCVRIEPGAPYSGFVALLGPGMEGYVERAAPASPSATPRGEFTNATHGYAVTLPEPYHLSQRLTMRQIIDLSGAISKHPAAQDVFTVLTPEQEDAGSRNCETACPVWNHTAVVLIYTDAGAMTAREWYEAGNAGRSVASKLEDVTISGRAALKVEPGSAYPIQYIVPDGNGRMFMLAYVIHSSQPTPRGASEQKLRAILDSFRLTSHEDVDVTKAADSVTIGGRTYRIAPESSGGTGVWRDFMPISEPNGKPMLASIAVVVDSGAFPTDVTVDHFWVVGREVWDGVPFELRRAPEGGTPVSRLDVIARSGPKWDPGIKVDVVVRVRAGDATYLLKLTGVTIQSSS